MKRFLKMVRDFKFEGFNLGIPPITARWKRIEAPPPPPRGFGTMVLAAVVGGVVVAALNSESDADDSNW